MFKVINKLILSIVSIGLSFSFFNKDPYFRFEKNIDNKKESFHNRFKQDTGGRLSYSDFISDKGSVYFSFYDVSFDNFYYDEYLNLNFQGLDFKDNNSYVRLRTRFKVDKNEIYCSDYTYKENRASNSSPYINYIVDRKDNFLYIKFVLEEVKKMLDGGAKPDEIINEHLIAAINEVGELFDKKKYFLPQLISSANTMKLAIEYLEPMLERSNTEAMATIVVATVEGDIHDIGKNLVVLMLKNYGYHVIDLGKDVPADVIVDTAMNEGAKVIGLSALMTTTMMRMKDVVELAKEKGCTAKIVIGGAAITESFSDEIGADGYSKDAAECVKLVERLLA